MLQKAFGGTDEIFGMPERGALRISFDLAAEYQRVQQLTTRYADLPASLADTCLVRMTELIPASRVMTLDSDFVAYRRHGRQSIPLLAPFA